MAPYAANYPARSSEGEPGPVIITLALGAEQDHEEHQMEIDSFEDQVVNEIIHFRTDEVDLPTRMDGLVWEVRDTKPTTLTVVLDTNILISHLPLLQKTVATLTQHHTSTGSAPSLTFIVPTVAILELDGLKNSHKTNPHGPSVAELARSATKWLLSAVPKPGRAEGAPSFIRGQQKRETLIAGGEEGRRREKREGGAGGNDSLVLDAVAYFDGRAERAVLLTDDKNLRLRANIDGIEAMGVNVKWTPTQLLAELDPAWDTRSVKHSPVMIPIPYDPPPHQAGSSSRLRTPSPVLSRKNTPPTPTEHLPPLSCPSPRRSPRSFASQAMEVDFEPTSLAGPPSCPADVLRKTGAAFSQLLAAPIFRRITGQDLPRQGALWPAELQQWYDRLGDGRTWDGARCARVLRAEWNVGGIADLCQQGIDVYKRKPGSSKGQGGAATNAKLKARRPAEVLLSVRHLEQVWAADGLAGCGAWSGGRWGVVLDEVHEVLAIFLAGLHPQVDLTTDLERIVGDWKAQLGVLGLDLD